MGIHLIVLSESYPMNTKMTGFRCFFKNLCILVLYTKVASALEGLSFKKNSKYMIKIKKLIWDATETIGFGQ